MHEFGPGWGHSDKTNLRGKRRKPARVECAEPAFKVSEAGVGYLTASAPYMTLFDTSHISSSPHTSLSALFITSFTQIQRDPSIKSIKSSLLCLYMTLLQPSPLKRFIHHQRQNSGNLLTNHFRNLDAATPIRFTTLSCKSQSYHAGSHSSEEP